MRGVRGEWFSTQRWLAGNASARPGEGIQPSGAQEKGEETMRHYDDQTNGWHVFPGREDNFHMLSERCPCRPFYGITGNGNEWIHNEMYRYDNAGVRKENPHIITPTDPVNHPSHYNSHPSGVECIEITRHMNFNLGNATKYLWRAGLKGDAIEDLKKAVFYLNDEIKRREQANGKDRKKDAAGAGRAEPWLHVEKDSFESGATGKAEELGPQVDG